MPTLPALISTTAEAIVARAITAIRSDRGLVVVTPFATLAWWMTWLSPTLVDWLNHEGWWRRRVELPGRH